MLTRVAIAGLMISWAGCSNDREAAPAQVSTPALLQGGATPPGVALPTPFGSTTRVDFVEAEGLIGRKLHLPTYAPKGLAQPNDATVGFEGAKPLYAEVRYNNTGQVPVGEQAVRSLEITFFSYDWQSGFDEAIDVHGTQVLIGENVVGVPIVSAAWLEDGRSILVVAFGQRQSDSEDLRREVMRIIESMID